MVVVLDSKDLASIDEELSAESQVWEVLRGGGQELTEADFVGAKEVRINKMTGFTASDYKRNEDNSRAKLSIEKETVKLTQERWMAYDLDALDQKESAALTIENATKQHARLISTPDKDKYAMGQIIKKAGKVVEETITSANALSAYDDAEQYMTDIECTMPLVMFATSDYYKALKNADGVSKTFTTNEMSVNGINRKVAQIDGGIPILKVAKGRIQVDPETKVNFVLLPLEAVSAIEKYNTVDLVPASQDRDGYRDTVKGLNYYDAIVLENAEKVIYLSKSPKA